jgi:hypothetical protein
MTPNTKFEFKSLQPPVGWGDVSYVPMPKKTRFDGVMERIMDIDEQRRQDLERFAELLSDPRTYFDRYPHIHLEPLRPWQDSIVDHFRDSMRYSVEIDMITAPIPRSPLESLRGLVNIGFDPSLEGGEWFLAYPDEVVAYSSGDGEDGPA